MKNKILKIFVLFSLVAAMLLSLFSCAKVPTANDANGDWQGISWNYYKETKTLVLRGTGAMPNASSSEEIGWASVRASVQRVKFEPLDGQYPTTIGAYAFYGMSSLTEIDIPQEVTSIGKCAFAFCTSLTSVNLPARLESISDSAFEACTTIESIKIPSNVTYIGERAFAFCRNLKVALIAGAPESIYRWTFKDCAALTTLAISNKDTVVLAEGAFEGASQISAENLSAYSESVIITVYYKDANGVEIYPSLTETKAFNEEYSYVPVAIDGYTASGELQYKGVVEGSDLSFTFTYTKDVETEPVVDTSAAVTEPVEEEEKSPVSMIVALVIFVLVIGGICVGAFLLIRSDKKQKKNGTTVRKNDTKKDGKKKK